MDAIFDDAIVGAGIVGLAHAYHLSKRGRRVIVFERSPQAQGASVRNFGMLWPIGQTAGVMYRMARRSREIWLDVLRDSGIWHEETGSLHLAYREDEAEVLREFCNDAPMQGYDASLLDVEQVLARSSAVNPEGLMAGMWSATETCVDPRQVIAQLPAYLSERFGVTFQFNTAVTAYAQPCVVAGGREWKAERLLVCSGDDFQTLYPEKLQRLGAMRCKLQMMRSQPYGGDWHLGPMLAGGLTLRHYKSFETCPSLRTLRMRVAAETPHFDRYGIHVMASQNGQGELILGDSHVYGDEINPFDNAEIDDLILGYLRSFLNVPADLRIAGRWHGVYAKHGREPYLAVHPAPGATAVVALGGAGMTLSFGLAEHVVRDLLCVA